MGLFNNYMKEGKGVSKDEKTPRLILFFQIFFRKFWNLIIINLLYVLFCLPVVTIGPATAALTKLMRNYAREEHAFIWGDFIETFKKNFKQAFLYSVLDLFVVAFLVLDFMAVSSLSNQVMTVLSLAAILLSFTIWTFMRFYIYNMMVTFRLTFKQLLKNAFIFCWVGFFRNLFIFIVIAAVTIFTIYLNYIYQLFVFALIYFSFVWYLTNFMVNPLIKKHMIDGYDPKTGEKIEEEEYEGFDDLKK